MSDRPVTGIEVTWTMPATTKYIAGVLHKLHLDKVNEWIAAATHLHVWIDQEKHDLPLALAQIVPCAPGDHHFACTFFNTGTMAVRATWHAMNGAATANVHVPEGQILTVRYVHDGYATGVGVDQNAHIEIVGTRAG